ncbi:MAG: carbohydrate ABC transporter permease [Anaerolineae bacterium]
MAGNIGINKLLNRAFFIFLLVVIFLYTVLPFYWAFASSLKTEAELISTPASFFPRQITFQNFEAVLRNEKFLRGLLNSAVVSVTVVLFSLVIGAFAAYALGRLKFRGRRFTLYVVLSMTLFPQISILPGLFSLVREFGMFGSIVSLMVTYLIFTLPFTVWVLTSFFRALPAELEQAALVDGCTPFQTFYKILLPLTAPALVTTGLLAFIAAWNEYLFALTFTLTQPAAQTVTVAIANFTGEVARNEPFGERMAAAVIVTIPLIILVLIFQRRIVQGLTAGAVKG